MPITEYRFGIDHGWTPQPTTKQRFSPEDDADAIGDRLEALGYKILANSGFGRCGVGTFFIWATRTPPQGWPRYALELVQLDDEGIVWIPTLPDLWEYIRLYGHIGWQMVDRDLNDMEDEDEDDDAGPLFQAPPCPDCGEPMTLTRAVPLTVVPKRDLDDA